MSELKQCTKCGEWKPATEAYFHSQKRGKYGLRAQCKVCRLEIERQYREAHPEDIQRRNREQYVKNREERLEYHREYREANHEVVLERTRNWRDANREALHQYDRQHYQEKREEILERKREWRLANPEEAREQDRQHHAKHKEKRHEIGRRNYLRNPRKEAKRRWRIRNKELVLVSNQRREARRKSLPDTLTLSEWQTALDYWQHRCAYCNAQKKLTMDHYIPLTDPACPGTIVTNTIPACLSCNSSKHTSNALEWLIRRFGEELAQAIVTRIEEYFRSVATSATNPSE